MMQQTSRFSVEPFLSSPFLTPLLYSSPHSSTLLSSEDFLPLPRWQGDGLCPNKLVHLSIRASVEVPAIMKLSGRWGAWEWWRDGEKKGWEWVMGLVWETEIERCMWKTEWEKRWERNKESAVCVWEESYWPREQIQLLKHHSCAAVRTELPCLADHPRSSSPRHHQPSLCFYATLPFTDLIFFPLLLSLFLMSLMNLFWVA